MKKVYLHLTLTKGTSSINMATVLDKDLVRESTVKVDGREILVTLTEKQGISMKLKGLKSGDVSISIEELYGQLTGTAKEIEVIPTEVKPSKKLKKLDGDPVINLLELRTHALVTKMDLKTKVELEGVICELIRQKIKIFEDE